MEQIKLEVGHQYWVRNPDYVGSVDSRITIVSKLAESSDGFEYIGSDGYSYRENGRFRPDGDDSDFDLVREVTP